MIIAQGAEAIIKKEGNTIIKERIIKSYRITQIDEELRKLRTRKESRILKKAKNIIPTPSISIVDEKNMSITMEYIEGEALRDCINRLNTEEVFKLIGEHIKKLHDNDIIHGDLTTSNIIIKENKPYFIDFGLSYVSTKIEDKAVDMHILRQALESKHYEIWEKCFNAFMKGYNPNNELIMRFEKVEGRGRYKQQKD